MAVPFALMEVIVIGTWRAHIASFSARQAAILGIAVFAGVGGVYLFRLDPPASPEILQDSPQTQQLARTVTGLSAAAQRVPLRNPFSAAHEGAGEAPVVSVRTNAAALVSMQMPPAAEASAVPAPEGRGAPAAPLVLRGVVISADGTRMAILGQGEEGTALTVGEEWHGYRLDGLTDTAATLQSASGTITLLRE